MDGLEVLCQQQAILLLISKDKSSLPQARQMYKQIFNVNYFADSKYSEQVNESWLTARSNGVVNQDWVTDANMRFNVNSDILNNINNLWEERLKSLICNLQLNAVVVWRYVRTPESTLGHTAWDTVDAEGFVLPKLEIHVAGGDKPDRKGNRFVWLLTVLPSTFLYCVDFPLGGAGKSSPLDFTYNDLISFPEVYDAHLMRGKGTDSWGALEMLLKLNAKIPDMTGYPVMNLRIAGLLSDWYDILERRGGNHH